VGHTPVGISVGTGPAVYPAPYPYYDPYAYPYYGPGYYPGYWSGGYYHRGHGHGHYHGGYRGGGGNRGGGGYHGGGYGGYNHGGGYGGYYHHGGYGAYPFFYGGYSSYPYYGNWGQGYYAGPGYYSAPPVVYSDGTYGSTVVQGGTPATTQSFYSGPSAGAQETRLRVIVPSADARVWVGGKETQQRGTERSFVSPPLPAGKTYTYSVRATWMDGDREVSRDKEVDVVPGQEAILRF
jgi:uncharacterized protein (TIGR03000 family)